MSQMTPGMRNWTGMTSQNKKIQAILNPSARRCDGAGM